MIGKKQLSSVRCQIPPVPLPIFSSALRQQAGVTFLASSFHPCVSSLFLYSFLLNKPSGTFLPSYQHISNSFHKVKLYLSVLLPVKH